MMSLRGTGPTEIGNWKKRIDMDRLTRGQVAKTAGVGVETVRFYEQKGLIPPAERSAANYRVYPLQTITRLRFIKRAKDLGFTLKEIRGLLTLRQNPTASKQDVKDQVEAKLQGVRQKIDDLKTIQAALESLDECCDGQGTAADCPILEALEAQDEGFWDTRY
jgi:Hg(II)-responsive transcriptional regulator